MKPKDWNRWQNHKMICKSKGYRKDQGIFSFRLLSNHEFLHMIIDLQLSRYSLSLAFRKHIWESFIISSVLPKRAHKNLSFVILRTHQTIILIRIHLWYGLWSIPNRQQALPIPRKQDWTQLFQIRFALSSLCLLSQGLQMQRLEARFSLPQELIRQKLCINWIVRLSAPSWLLSVYLPWAYNFS